ncbi:MAG: Ig-like domain-containing domain [Bacteroidota bacterium]
MNQIQKFLLFPLLIIVLLFSKCANIIPPSGGEKDIQAPEVIKASPPIETTNFKAKQITIEFNEYFNLDNPAQQIVISPPMNKNPEYTIVGKKLIINLKDNLLPNVTYNINFGDAIKDFNEGNILKNFSYVFSTGNYVDTFQLKGVVSNAKDNQAAESVIVGLYKSFDDSVIYNSKPYYFAKTDKNGNYYIKNIHEGSYKIVALKDENLDYKYNNSELIGFNRNIFFSDTNAIQQSDIKVFKEKSSKLKLIDVLNPEVGLIKFVYNNPIQNFKFDASIYSTSDIAFINITKDTISYYYSKYNIKNTTFYITTNTSILDTFQKELFYIKETEIDKYKLQFKTNTTSSSDTKSFSKSNDSKQDMYQKYTIDFNRPCTIQNTNLISLYEDSVEVNRTNYSITVDAKDKTKYFLNYPFKSNSKYTIQFKKAALLDLFGFVNDDLKKSFLTLATEDYGSIIINNKINSEKNYVVQVLDANFMMVYTTTLKNTDLNKKIILNNYPAGTYHIQVIEDLNANQIWDTGNYLLGKYPEKIFTINNNLVLKAGWDAEVDIAF